MNIPSASFTLKLPQLTAELSISAGREYLLVAGGRPPQAEWLRAAADSRSLHAVDRGLDSILSAGLMPDRLIGDGDSASPDAWQAALSAQVPVEKFPVEKDYTDTDLALQKIKAEEPSAFVILSGAFGGRFDHAFSTMYSLLGSGLSGCLADGQECMLLLHGPAEVSVDLLQRPSAISLLPLTSSVTGVTMEGVHWALSNATLLQEQTLSVSNRLAEGRTSCNVSLKEGSLGVYFVWDEAAL